MHEILLKHVQQINEHELIVVVYHNQLLVVDYHKQNYIFSSIES